MAGEVEQQLRAYVEYLRDMGVHDFYRQGEPVYAEVASVPVPVATEVAVVDAAVAARPLPASVAVVEEQRPIPVASRPEFLEPPIPKLVSFDDLVSLPEIRVDAAHKAEALA